MFYPKNLFIIDKEISSLEKSTLDISETGKTGKAEEAKGGRTGSIAGSSTGSLTSSIRSSKGKRLNNTVSQN